MLFYVANTTEGATNDFISNVQLDYGHYAGAQYDYGVIRKPIEGASPKFEL